MVNMGSDTLVLVRRIPLGPLSRVRVLNLVLQALQVSLRVNRVLQVRQVKHSGVLILVSTKTIGAVSELRNGLAFIYLFIVIQVTIISKQVLSSPILHHLLVKVLELY
jgi:hypothetical protein